MNTLREFFVAKFGPDTRSTAYTAAQRRFTESMAGYSLVTYFLQIKVRRLLSKLLGARYLLVCLGQDRHNGNILCNSEGRIIHIDFGFMLSTSPGELGFEAAPFKLSEELVDVMRGVRGSGPATDGSPASTAGTFDYFEALCVEGFLAARRQFHRLALQLQNAKEGSSHRISALVHLRDTLCCCGRARATLLCRWHDRWPDSVRGFSGPLCSHDVRTGKRTGHLCYGGYFVFSLIMPAGGRGTCAWIGSAKRVQLEDCALRRVPEAHKWHTIIMHRFSLSSFVA